MRPALLDGKPVEKPPQLAATDGNCAALARFRPRKSASFEPSIIQPESAGVPVQYLELIAGAVAENKPAFGEYVELETETDHRRQTVDGLPHISGPAGQIDPAWLNSAQHIEAATHMTSPKTARSNPRSISIRATPT